MVFSSDNSQLLLGGAVLVHVHAGGHGVDVHKRGAGSPAAALSLLLLGLFLLIRHKGIQDTPDELNVGVGHKHVEHGLLVIGVVHLLHPYGQSHVVGSGLDAMEGAVNGAGGPGAGVLHVHHRDALNAEGGEGHLTADTVLAGDDAPEGVGVPGRLDILLLRRAVLHQALDHLGRHGLDGLVGVFSETEHAHADDVDVLHRLILL